MSEDQISKEVFETLWKNREEVGKWLAGLFSWFRKPPQADKRGILILGAGGVGKSTLGKMLSGDFDFMLDLPGVYVESVDREKYALKDDLLVEITVPPGQAHRRLATWGDLLAAVGAGEFRGVILVSAYGYHSIGDYDYRLHKLYSGDKRDFIKKYVESRRDDELSILRELAPHLSACQNKTWLLSVVTKRDLWWSHDQQADRHYREETYAACVDEILRVRGANRFRHELVFTSLVISNFVTSRSDILAKNSSGYDQHRQVASLRGLFSALDAMRNWEAGHG